MLITMEMRWFNSGLLPEELKDWFQYNSLGEYLGPPEEREDVYLYAAGCDYLGIKLRQQRMELKWRQAELGALSFEDRVEGKAEKWIKWSGTETPAESMTKEVVVQQRPWVSVKKVRWLRRYQFSGGKSISAVPIDESISQGCSVELTQLGINGNAWWSFALEAFGENGLIDNLQSVARWIFKTYQAPNLRVEASYGYPQWLSVVLVIP